MQARRRISAAPWCLAATAVLALVGSATAEPPKKETAKTEGFIKAEPIKPEVWKNASRTPIKPGEIDEMIAQALAKAGVKPGPVASDEEFIRRVCLDLTGRLPRSDEVRAFLADTSKDKRAKLIDKLLESDAYARHWSKFWHDVIASRLVANFQSRILARSFQQWLTQQLRENKSWDKITREMLTATGQARFDDTEGKSGPAFFLASHMGADAVVEQTAETSRVFLGIQINCAQCHDHPYDVWKRENFHELAAYFARVRTRLVRDPESQQIRFIGVELVSTDRGFGGGFGGGGGRGRMGGEHRMPAKDDPRSGTIMHPRSLDGKTPGRGLRDTDRRKALVDWLTSKDNHWFAAAYVNRVWGVLMGQAFYQPVDDMGPQKEAVHGPVLARLAAAFAGSDYDMKNFFRVVMNSETYQRRSRVGESVSDHLQFAAVYPNRLRPNAVYDSLSTVLGGLDSGFGGRGGAGMGGPRRGGLIGGVRGMIENEFGFDPSLKNEDIEGSIPQALILMNNPQINQRIRAQGNNVLARILAANSRDDAAIEAVYLQALARKPTANELKKCLAYVKKVGNRAEAFEDILWALVNSTEFQTKR